MQTTREEARIDSKENLVGNLKGLLEKNYDAEKGFKKALNNANNEHLKNFLKTQAVQRNRFATELDNELRTMNEKPKESGSATGTIHRTWMDFKSTIAGNNDEAVLEECIRGEKASEKEYRNSLKENHFPPNIENVLNKHLNEIQTTLSQVKTMESLAERKDI
ncbi:MAG: PA2169 family four-helix-bundle protein [Flavobacteriaceae bacterium]